MLTTLQLKDIIVGQTDAKHELLTNNPVEKKIFQESYVIPSNILLEEFIKGKKYFVTGLKGIGKTALLRYIDLEVEESIGAATSFILFKSHFSDQDKKDITRASNMTVVENNVDDNESSYIDIWKWFFYRHIVSLVVESEKPIFVRDKNWDKFKAVVTAPNIGNEESGIKRLLPKLKRGSFEIGAGLDGVSGKLGLEFDWEDQQKTKVKFNSLVKQADNLFKELLSASGALYLFIDELELSISSQKQFMRDTKLIRDLIIAIHEINTICRMKSYNITLIGAIRSEVLTSMGTAGHEINKITEDFGKPINWHKSSGSVVMHPLIQMIIKKLIVSEKHNQVEPTEDSTNLFKKYFPDFLHERTAQEYLLNQTWYRPRDIVRLLTFAKEYYPNEEKFTQKVFDETRKAYSEASWVESSEELAAKYTINEIKGIKQLFLGISNPFTFEQIKQRSQELSDLYSELSELLEKNKLGSILSDCYRIGVIGNTGQKVRFAYRGDDEIMLDKQIQLHRSLWPYLQVEKNESFNYKPKPRAKQYTRKK
ncbi:P-loop ATPase, Sll1717 family [Sporosarcina sp. SG10008]|uniref:P-loop ATPase, Sll1717 family n=1 Tax=Sporosarcina sp. SG10008 TaxID=3373103 RepID=UPI0037DC5261